jgi:phenol 2-monooxygenase (NADPH)
MQFHLNGVRGSSDPLVLQFRPEETEADFQSSLPEQIDVLIVGAGPAGHLLATQLSRFPSITTRLIEPRSGRLPQGQADGLQCRTVEIFEAFGFSEKVLKEAYWVNETTFWSPTEDGKGLRRTGRIRDTEEGMSEFPHVILSQSRMQDLWLESMKWSPTRLEPSYSRKMVGMRLPKAQDGLVEVDIERTDAGHKGEVESVRAKYVVGCDGARSIVRRSLGLEMKGDFANQAWGVMDALAATDFPDWRLKTIIHSANAGSVVIIPREGGYLDRLYIELDKLNQDERVSNRKITAEMAIERAQKIFHPFKLDVKDVSYWSYYEVGQRLTDHFDDVPKSERTSERSEEGERSEGKGRRNPRVFIAGDACHTHSAKAGQGMNVSMNDAYNLGWKLAAVLHGHADPKILHTYTEERQEIAKVLIDFDRKIARMTASRPAAKTSASASASGVNGIEGSKGGEDEEEGEFQQYFERQGRFMAGVETVYPAGLLTSSITTHQHLAKGFQIGTRFHSAQVLRLSDAKPVHLGHVMKADGRWRILILGTVSSNPAEPSDPVNKMCSGLEQDLIPRYTPKGEDIDSIFDTRCILPQPRARFLDLLPQFPEVLFPHKGKFGLQDYEKVFVDEESYGFGHGRIFETRQIDKERGAVVVVRPDQYVAGVWPLDAEEEVEKFFGGFMMPVKEREGEGSGEGKGVVNGHA